MKIVNFEATGFMITCDRLLKSPIIITAKECGKCSHNQGFLEIFPGVLVGGVRTGEPVQRTVDELVSAPYIQPTPDGSPEATPRPYVYNALCGKPTAMPLRLTGSLNFDPKE